MKRTWLNGKTVIISGASSGIGLETARQLIDGYGCSVIGIAQNIAKLTKAKELLGSNFSYYSFDVKSEENWKNFRGQPPGKRNYPGYPDQQRGYSAAFLPL